MCAMLTFRIPPEEGNAGLKDGRFTPTLQSIMEDLQPEAAYFGPVEGARGGYLVVNIDNTPSFVLMRNPFSSDWARPSRFIPSLPQTRCPG